MGELTFQERLQPSLLDRLTDDSPDDQRESRLHRVVSLEQLRASVLRDLGWLLNTSNLATVTDLELYPQVARSVLNYGVPDLSGHTVLGLDVATWQRQLRQAVGDFEPRILPDTLQVRVQASDRMSRNALTLEIEGQLWAQPVPLKLFLRTELDLETGNATVVDYLV